MALRLEALGEEIGPLEKEYSWRDVILYALGVGAGFDELEYVYEKGLKVIPTFSIAAVFDFLIHLWEKSGINLAGLLHGEQEIEFHSPLPSQGRLITRGRIIHFYDMGDRGALVVGRSETTDGEGKMLFTGTTTLVARLDGNFGGEAPPKGNIKYPEKEPDYIIEDSPSPNQPLIYRLSGDFFPLHVDPDFARSAGFKGPIMHGLCTLGFACRACIKAIVPGAPERVKKISCRFSRPLYPGTPIKTLIWKTGPGSALYRVINAHTGEIVLDKGQFQWKEEQGHHKKKHKNGLLLLRGDKEVLSFIKGAVEEIEEKSLEINEGDAEDGEVVKGPIEGLIFALPPSPPPCPFENISVVQWRERLTSTLGSLFTLSKDVFSRMKSRGKGRIIFIISPLGFYGEQGYSLVCTESMAVLGFANTLKEEGEKYNIGVNVLAPAIGPYLPVSHHEGVSRKIMGNLLLHLLSKDASTGRIYLVCGENVHHISLRTGEGVVLSRGEQVPEVEEIRDHIREICSLKHTRTYKNLGHQLISLLEITENIQGR